MCGGYGGQAVGVIDSLAISVSISARSSARIEHQLAELGVAGSNPAGRTIRLAPLRGARSWQAIAPSLSSLTLLCRRSSAVEQRYRKPWVTGSNPVGGSTIEFELSASLSGTARSRRYCVLRSPAHAGRRRTERPEIRQYHQLPPERTSDACSVLFVLRWLQCHPGSSRSERRRRMRVVG